MKKSLPIISAFFLFIAPSLWANPMDEQPLGDDQLLEETQPPEKVDKKTKMTVKETPAKKVAPTNKKASLKKAKKPTQKIAKKRVSKKNTDIVKLNKSQVKRLQASLKIKVDGLMGPKTRSALKN